MTHRALIAATAVLAALAGWVYVVLRALDFEVVFDEDGEEW